MLRLFAFALFLLTATGVAAHEVKTADGQIVNYEFLKNPNDDRPCCGNKDCMIVPWRGQDGHFEIYIEKLGQWIEPDESTLMPLPHPDAPNDAHACQYVTDKLPRCVWIPGGAV